MTTSETVTVAVAVWVALCSVIIWAWWRWVEAPSRAAEQARPPRHARPPSPVTPACPECVQADTGLVCRADLGGSCPTVDGTIAADWREDWTSDELDQLAGRKPIEFHGRPAWDYAAQRAGQQQWLLDRRREAAAVTDDLVRGLLADLWWTRRR